MLDLGFLQSKVDYSLFTWAHGDFYIAPLVYVDNIFIASIDQKSVDELKLLLDAHFYVKDFGQLKYFVNLEIALSPMGFFFNANKSIYLKYFKILVFLVLNWHISLLRNLKIES